jgi:hypothetical protein
MLRRPPTRLQLKTDDIEEYEEVRFCDFIDIRRVDVV